VIDASTRNFRPGSGAALVAAAAATAASARAPVARFGARAATTRSTLNADRTPTAAPVKNDDASAAVVGAADFFRRTTHVRGATALVAATAGEPRAVAPRGLARRAFVEMLSIEAEARGACREARRAFDDACPPALG